MFASLLKKLLPKALHTPNPLSRSETFCMAPWIQLHAQTHGEVTPCGTSQYKGEPVFNLRENPHLAEAWNSEKMKAMRRNMLQGKKNKICENYYQNEALGKCSERQQYNKDYYAQYAERVKSTLEDGTVIEQSIPLLDVRFSNTCNYKCRICNSSNSSLLYAEDLKLGKIARSKPKLMKAAENEEAFWNSYTQLLQEAKRLHFAGGESFFMEEHYKTLEHLIAAGRTDVILSYNTNLSILHFREYNLIDLWRNFKRVEIWASLDDMGARGDYQRKGQQWNVIEENIRTIQRDCPHVLFGIDITVSVFNVLYIPQFFRYMTKQGLVSPQRVNLYFLQAPDYFNVTNLTPELKKNVLERYDGFIREQLSAFPQTHKIKEQATALLRYMNLSQTGKQAEFIKRIKETDEIRNENFTATFPELSDMMKIN